MIIVQASKQDNFRRKILNKWIIFSLVVLGVVGFQFSGYAGTWSQSTQEEFVTCTLSNIDQSTSSGDIKVGKEYSPDSNTVLLMHFNEGSGNPQDSSGNGHNGTITGATWTTAGKFGNALSFDGNDFVKQQVLDDETGATFWPTNAGACFDATNARFRVAGVDLSPFASAANDYMLVIKDSADKVAWGYIDVADVAEALGDDLFDQYKGTFDLTNIRGAELSSGNLAVGKIYEISAHTEQNFTDDGAPDNNVGTTFTATDTTVTLDADDKVYPLNISWDNYGTNQVSIDTNALKITYVDNVNGALLPLRDSKDLSSDLTVGALYKLTFDGKVGAGNSIVVRLDVSHDIDIVVTETSFTSKTIYFIASSTTGDFLQIRNMSAGEIIWLDNIILKEVTNVGTDGVLIMSTKGGTTQSWADQESGIDLNDIDSFEVLKEFQITGNLTVEAWVNATDATNFIIADKLSGNYGYLLNLDGSDHVNFTVGDGTDTQSATGSAAVSESTWHHVAGTYDGANIKIYLDGTLIDTQAQGNPGDTSEPLRFGYDGTNYANGIIDEVRISNIVRYTSNFTPASSLTSATITSPTINSGESITNIRLDWEDERPAGTSITYYTTNDGGGNWYELPGDNVLFTFPSLDNDLRVKAELKTGSGTPTLLSWFAEFNGDPFGAVYDAITGQTIAGAQVTLHTPDGLIYSGTPQDNPQITDSLGRYNFYAEKGKYYITATVQGYRDYTSSIFTQDGGNVLVNCNMYPLDYVDENGLLISQTANKAKAKRGDIITYFFKVKNISSSSISSPEISIKLPYNFKYVTDSALRDGVKSTDPSETSGRLIFSPDSIGVNTAITYSYRVRVGIDAYEGRNISEGIVNYISLGQDISTGPVYAVVYIKSLFSPKGLVIGKVFEDTNSNGIQDIGESPIPYVAILSEDGRVVLTDENGQYSIINFNYDTHVLKLDQRVLPGGPFAIFGLNPPKDFPKDIPPISRTIDIPKSGIVKANFPITSEERQRYSEINKVLIAAWEERLSGIAKEDEDLKEIQAQKDILTGYYEKAMAYYKKGKYDEAISEWKKIDKAYKERKESIEPILSKKSRETPQNEFILVGLADGELGKLSRFGNVASTEASDKEKLHKELYKNGRVAFYLKGIIQGKYLLTARIDTSKDLEDELYESIDADRYYPIYGDTSTQIDETDSQESLYVVLTWNKNLIKYGNFGTEEFSEVEYAKYSRTLPGLKIHLEGDRAEITNFLSHSRQVPRKDYINPRGLSGPYYLSRNPVIEQSERVYLEIHDKDKDDVVLSTISYERDKDYDMFYDDGYIYFSEPIRSEDRYGNPQYIVVEYEYAPPLDPQYITQGVRIQIEPIPETLTLGFSNVTQNADDLHLTSGDTEIKLLNNTTTISGEYSYSNNNFTNYATKAQINSTFIPKVNFSGHYLNVNDGFSNPTGTLDQGVKEYRGKIAYNILKPTDIILDSYSRRSILSHMRTIHYGGEIINRWDRLALSGKATYERQKDEDTMNSLSDMKWTTLGGDLSYRLTKKITLHSGYEWEKRTDEFPLGDSANQFNTFTGRIDYQLDKDNLLYLRNDHIEASGYMKNISAVGVEQILDENTTSYAEYEKDGSTLRQNMGYKSKVKLTKWLSSNVSFERSRVSGPTSLDSDASSVSLEARPKDELWITSKVECRHYQKTKEYNLNYESKGELTPDLTAFSKGSFSRSKDQDTCTTTRRDKQGVIGLSYRPVACDRLNVIGKYEYKRKENIQIASQESQTTNHIGSVEGAYDLTKNMILGARYAMNKSVEKGQDSIDRSHINLFVASLNYRLTPSLDVLTEGRYIYLHETGDWKLGSSIEVGYRPIKDLRLGLGYTFTEYNDADQAHDDQDYLSRGPYFKISISPSF